MAYRFALTAAVLAFSITASSGIALAVDAAAGQYSGTSASPAPGTATPPVFKDTTGQPPSGSVEHLAPATPPAIPAGTPGNSANPTAATAATAPAAAAAPAQPVPPDPCESSQGNYDAYTVCQDMIQKIERMKKGNAARQEVYHPAPPPEAKKPEEAKKEEAKTDEKKDEAKTDDKSGDKSADKSAEAKPDAKTAAKTAEAKPEEKKPAPDPNEYGGSNEYGANSSTPNLQRP